MRLRVPESFGPLRGSARGRTRTASRGSTRRSLLASSGAADGWQWWEAAVEVENPVHGYRWLLVGDRRPAALAEPASGSRPSRRATTTTSGSSRTRRAPEWAASSVHVPGVPRPVRAVGAPPTTAPSCPNGRSPAEWGDPRRPRAAGPLAAVLRRRPRRRRASTSTTSSRLGVNLLYLTPVLPGALEPPLRRARPSTTSTRCSAATRRSCGSSRRRTPAGIRVIGDLTTNHSGDAHEWFRAAHGRPRGARARLLLLAATTDSAATCRGSGVPSLPKFNWSSAELRRRFIEGPDSVVARLLEPPFSLDGWRIDVANMTGRLGDEDLNAEVRQHDPPHDARGEPRHDPARASRRTTPRATSRATRGTAR